MKTALEIAIAIVIPGLVLVGSLTVCYALAELRRKRRERQIQTLNATPVLTREPQR